MYKQKYDESFYSYFPSMIEDSSETHNRFLDQELIRIVMSQERYMMMKKNMLRNEKYTPIKNAQEK